MQFLLIFLSTSVISFVGSLQAGTVNVSVVQTALEKNLKAALWLALGGCLPEMFYAGLAIFVGMYVQSNPVLMRGLSLVTVPVFLGLGLYQLFSKPKSITEKEKKKSGKSDFWQGLGLAFLNPQLLPFWFGVFVYLSSSFFPIDTVLLQTAFVAGTACGAGILLVLIAIFTNKKREKVKKIFEKYNFNHIIGWLFIGMAFLKLLSILAQIWQ